MIYFVEASGLGMIKIGLSGKDPDRRLSDLQVGCPVKLIRVALMAGGLLGEQLVHGSFPDEWSHGEWFRYSDRLRRFVEENATPWTQGSHTQFLRAKREPKPKGPTADEIKYWIEKAGDTMPSGPFVNKDSIGWKMEQLRASLRKSRAS